MAGGGGHEIDELMLSRSPDSGTKVDDTKQ